MADQVKALEVCTDTCVLINLAHVSRLDLLGQLQDMVFHAPQEVLNEVTDPGQMRKVEAAMENGALRSFKIAAVEELESVAEYANNSAKARALAQPLQFIGIGWLPQTRQKTGGSAEKLLQREFK
jgi:predicted nucleic acid-binding protein